MANSYIRLQRPDGHTAAPAKVTTGTAIEEMLQLVPAVPIKPIEWGVSFDGRPPPRRAWSS